MWSRSHQVPKHTWNSWSSIHSCLIWIYNVPFHEENCSGLGSWVLAQLPAALGLFVRSLSDLLTTLVAFPVLAQTPDVAPFPAYSGPIAWQYCLQGFWELTPPYLILLGSSSCLLKCLWGPAAFSFHVPVCPRLSDSTWPLITPISFLIHLPNGIKQKTKQPKKKKSRVIQALSVSCHWYKTANVSFFLSVMAWTPIPLSPVHLLSFSLYHMVHKDEIKGSLFCVFSLHFITAIIMIMVLFIESDILHPMLVISLV